jgi:hypothetical protein
MVLHFIPHRPDETEVFRTPPQFIHETVN